MLTLIFKIVFWIVVLFGIAVLGLAAVTAIPAIILALMGLVICAYGLHGKRRIEDE
jgi:uncharacterized membrane-anchored protein